MNQSPSTSHAFSFSAQDSARLLSLYTSRDLDRLSAELLGILQVLNRTTFLQMGVETQADLDEFVNCFLFLMTRQDYAIPDPYALELVKASPLIGNIVAISSFRTTDAQLSVLGRQTDNLVKVLALYSARNTVHADRKSLFDTNPSLASLWYSNFYSSYNSALVSEDGYRHMRQHLAYVDPRMTLLHQFHHMAFSASYIDPDLDRPLKEQINQVLQEAIRTARVEVHNQPNRRRLAVITNRWFPSHSVYRTTYPYLEALAKDYELVLVHLGPPRSDTAMSLFKEMRQVDMSGPNSINVRSIQDNDFQVALYPEVGMCMESLFLSNLRIAPIQVATYGHSVSTFGSAIDYWIGGADVELESELSRHYSERMVLLPGLGVAFVKPNYALRHIPTRTDRMVVNLCWYPQKVNWPLVCMLKAVLGRTKQDVLFRFFSGGGLGESNHFLPFVRSLTQTLGARHVEVMPSLSYPDYMARMQEAALCLDSYHYGGCNTVVDSFHVRKPIATRSGRQWYNRIGGAILRQVGLDALVADSEAAYVDLCVRLIDDEPWRHDLQQQVDELDLEGLLYNRPQDRPDFKFAIDYLVENHDRLQSDPSRAPIHIAELMAKV